MDLNLKALIGVTYLIPIAITLRKIYAPDFELPDSFVLVLAKLDPARHGKVDVPMAAMAHKRYEMRV